MLRSGDKFRKLLTLLITWGLLMACFIGYEQYYTRGQERFLQDSEFRQLNGLSNELASRFDQARISAESSISLLASKTLICADQSHQTDKDAKRDCLRRYLHLYFGDAWDGNRDASSRDRSLEVATHCSPDLDHPLLFVPEGLTLNVLCFQSTGHGRPKALLSTDNATLVYSFDLTPWIRTAFEQLDGDFNDVLITDSKGHVVFQKSTDGPRIGDLSSLLPYRSSTDANPKSSGQAGSDPPPKKQAKEQSAQEQRTADSPIDRLIEDTAITPITLAGRNYQLFSQPIVLALSISGSKQLTMVVGGLQDATRLREQSHSLPYSVLIWATLVLVALFSFSWPLFKLRYMSNTERFSIRDGWFLILAILLASTSLMLMLLNASYTLRTRDDADRTLKGIADQIKTNFPNEVRSAFGELQRLSAGVTRYTLNKSEWPILISNFLNVNKSNKACYPYFEMANYANRQGQQILKLDLRSAPTPAVNVGTRPFFKRIIWDDTWRSETPPQPDAGSSNCATLTAANIDNNYVEPLLSKTTNEFFAVLSARFPSKPAMSPIAVHALSTKPMSLVNPVLPPGYQFAVIDVDCNVLFHSDSFRNMRENFCQNSKYKDELRPWLFSGAQASLDISYGGHTERAYLSSMPDSPRFTAGQVFLIVFREPDVELTLNLAVFLVCSILMGTYFAIVLLAAVLHLALRHPLGLIYAPRFIWPCSDNALGYLEVSAANGLIILLFFLFYSSEYEGPLLVLTFSTATLSIVFFLVRLTRPRKTMAVLGIVLICAASARWLASLLYPSSSISEWDRPSCLVGIAGVMVLALSGLLFRIKPLRSWRIATSDAATSFAKRHFTIGYVLAALTVIIGSALVPCVGSFKYAYDAVSELSLKHDQLILANALRARSARIHKYYSDTVHPPIFSTVAQERICSTIDRYDRTILPGSASPLFSVGYTPDRTQLSPTPGSLCPSGQVSESPTVEDAKGINRRIERAVAGATLYFPSNKLGAEMSKLGVASTETPETNTRHFWRELTPTRFLLSEKGEPGSPELTIASEYRPWRGLRLLPLLCLVVLETVLTAWLISLVRNIFLTEVGNTRTFPVVNWKDAEEIAGSFLVIGWAKSGKSNWLKSVANITKHNWLDLRVELRKKSESRNCLLPITQRSVLVLDHFEFNMTDSACNEVRLRLLETLLYESTTNVVVVSTVDPLYFLTEGSPGVLAHDADPAVARKLLDRWARALSKLTKVRLEKPEDRDFQQALAIFRSNRPQDRDFATWVKAECNATMMLREIGKDLLNNFKDTEFRSPSLVWNYVLDRADTYYHTLWAGFTSTERLVLYQLAFDGWANPQNGAAIQQLERKLVIHKHPMYRIVNESFRLFIRSTEHADEIAEWRRREQQSTWHAFRFVLMGVVVGVAGWLLYTQAAFSQTVASYVAGITALLTATAGLLGRFGRQPSAVVKEP